MRRSSVTPTVVRVGSVDQDAAALASKVVETLADGPRFIWIADDNCLYSGTLDRPNEVHESWIVGTFSLGHPVEDIAEDLRVVANERTRNWILD